MFIVDLESSAGWRKTHRIHEFTKNLCSMRIAAKESLAPCICSFFAACFALPVSADEIEVWEYHAAPPFVIDAETERGLSYDLARLLTKNSGGRHTFSVELVPKLRLSDRLEKGLPGVVFWPNNMWFGDPEKNIYLWSRPILSGKSLVLSPASNPVEYVDASSIANMDLIGVRGYKYGNVDEQSKKLNIHRKDVSTEKAAIEFISVKPDGVVIMSKIATAYYLKKLQLKDQIHVSTLPHSTFDRYVLVQPGLENIHQYIDSFMSELQDNPEWTAILQDYGF